MVMTELVGDVVTAMSVCYEREAEGGVRFLVVVPGWFLGVGSTTLGTSVQIVPSQQDHPGWNSIPKIVVHM